MAQAQQITRERTRSERLEARITAEQKALIQRAADIEGRSLTDYVVGTVQDAAKRTLESHHTIVLDAADSRAFVDAMLDPAPWPERLKDSVRRYREITGV